MRVGVIGLQREILVGEIENRVSGLEDLHGRQFPWFTLQLESSLLEVVGIEMRIAESMDEFARGQTCRHRQHLCEQGIGSNIKGHSQEDVGTALVELAGESPVADVELE